jgi:uncharacterized protein (TIGR01244 family)
MRFAFLAAAAIMITAPAFAEDPIHFPQKLDRKDFQAMIADTGPVYIAGQPTEAALREMVASGVKTIINLRTQPEMDNRRQVPYDEEAVLKELGVTYVHIPLGGPDTPYTPAAVDQVADALAKADGKVLLHCTIAWRASHMWAAYLVKYKGYTLEEATRHAAAMNLNGYKAPGAKTTPLEDFLAIPAAN